MSEWVLGLGAALWFGVLTSISPCPLATNLAAISFLGRQVEGPGRVLAGGLLYTTGRVVVYVLLSVLLVGGLLAAPALSQFLQKSINQLLGPVLVVAGMFLLGLLSFNLPGMGGWGQRVQARLEDGRLGTFGASVGLGALFALSFCPVSAALFFGSLVPLAVRVNSPVAMPLAYGIGTALPVVGFAVVIALGARRLGQTFNRLSQFEVVARRATGVLFVLVGIYLSLVYVFGVQI